MNKHFLDLNNFSAHELERVLNNSIELKKQGKPSRLLEGKYVGLIFEKSSTRTRVSFEVAMTQLGGKASFLSVNDLQLGRGEPVADTAKVLSFKSFTFTVKVSVTVLVPSVAVRVNE